MKKIVITGGIGYIGTELCKIYSGESWNSKITVIDKRFVSKRVNQLTKRKLNKSRFRFFERFIVLLLR